MRIVYMGSPEPAIAPLRHLLDSPEGQLYELIAVVSQPAKLVGRGRAQAPLDPPVAAFARSRGLLTLQPAKARDEDFLATLRALAPDVVITCAYGQILTDAFLAIPRRATINIHPSALPHYRGAVPVPAALLDGVDTTAVSILFTVRALDAGALILQREFAIGPEETAGELTERLFAAAGPLLIEALEKLVNPMFTGEPQDETAATHCRKLAKDEGAIAWQLPSSLLHNRFRALHPWPGSYTHCDERRILIEALRLPGSAACEAPTSQVGGGP